MKLLLLRVFMKLHVINLMINGYKLMKASDMITLYFDTRMHNLKGDVGKSKNDFNC